MPRNPEVDEYIANSAEFAQPILLKLRELVHESHPEISETVKWRMPNFEYKGLLFNMAAFKQHCSFGFWKQKLIKGLEEGSEGLGSFGKIKSLEDLPSDEEILMYLKEAVLLNEKGIKVPKEAKVKKELVIPSELMEAFKKRPRAYEVFENFSYSHRKEYIEWVDEAKREATKIKRVEQTITWLLEGKRRNWKYENC